MRRFLRILLSLAVASLIYILLQLLFFSFNGENLILPTFINFLEPKIVFFVIMIIIGIIFGLLFYVFISNYLVSKIIAFENIIEDILINMNLSELVSSVIGAIVGLIIANLIGLAISKLPVIGVYIVTFLNMLFGIIGFNVANKRKEDFKAMFFKTSKGDKHEKQAKIYGRPKVLDTSVIIDGRILDILQTGFIEGKIIIPNFVLEELRHIADSSDALKRNRGRRGLDILNEIKKQSKVLVEILDWDSKDTDDVDTKLLKVGRKLDAFVVTNDFNLNKVAEFQKVYVLNINELSKSVKTVVLPGENIVVAIVKDGKENRQGIAYLDDGTMIVVEGGAKHIGDTLNVVVTSVLQTAAGRMIFAKIE